ncbi:hypothetical protein [Neobacillus niacini]|uniref:hypothetical protein n=1 Tax=Neobacillus niacini TaxID=86668 RepID=UPI003B589C18
MTTIIGIQLSKGQRIDLTKVCELYAMEMIGNPMQMEVASLADLLLYVKTTD